MRVKSNYNRKLSVPVKIMIVIGCLVIVMTAVFLLRETKLIRGYRYFLQRSVYDILNKLDGTGKNIDIDGRVYESDNFDTADKKAPFKIDKPGWLPEGYELKKTRYIEDMIGRYLVYYIYRDPDDDTCDIKFSIDTESYDIESAIIVDYEIMEINGKEVYLVQDFDSENISGNYLNNQGHVVYIICPLGKQTLIKIIENMD